MNTALVPKLFVLTYIILETKLAQHLLKDTLFSIYWFDQVTQMLQLQTMDTKWKVLNSRFVYIVLNEISATTYVNKYMCICFTYIVFRLVDEHLFVIINQNTLFPAITAAAFWSKENNRVILRPYEIGYFFVSPRPSTQIATNTHMKAENASQNLRTSCGRVE